VVRNEATGLTSWLNAEVARETPAGDLARFVEGLMAAGEDTATDSFLHRVAQRARVCAGVPREDEPIRPYPRDPTEDDE
jgi:hypothetical protein